MMNQRIEDRVLEIRIFRDGDKICALYGEDLQEGLVGFGDSIPEALNNLASEWGRTRGEESL